MAKVLAEHRLAITQIAEAEQRVALQKSRIIKLFTEQHDIRDAVLELKELEASLQRIIQHRDELAAKLGYSSQ